MPNCKSALIFLAFLLHQLPLPKAFADTIRLKSLYGLYQIKSEIFEETKARCYENQACLQGPGALALVSLGQTLALNKDGTYERLIDHNLIAKTINLTQLIDIAHIPNLIDRGQWTYDRKQEVITFNVEEDSVNTVHPRSYFIKFLDQSDKDLTAKIYYKDLNDEDEAEGLTLTPINS